MTDNPTPTTESTKKPLNWFEQKRADKAARLRARAEDKRGASQAALDRARQMSSIIPLGQPILIGHHSERFDRAYRGRIDNAYRTVFNLKQEAVDLEGRADSMESNDAIFTDDPDAPHKLEARITELENWQKQMKAANACIRKNDRAGLVALGMTEEQADKLMAGDYMGRKGFPRFELTNNNANINRLKQRLERVKRLAAAEDTEEELYGVKIEHTASENRTRVFFPGKPSDECRAELKSYGFRWAPSEGAWQRPYSNAALYYARQIVTKFYGSQNDQDSQAQEQN